MSENSGRTEKIKPAPLWRRLMAMCYDSLLLVAVIMAYGALYLELKLLVLGEGYQQQFKAAKAGSEADPLMFAGTLVAIFLFFYVFWRKRGQTLGMQVWRLQIQQEDGSMISAAQTLIRLLVAPVSMLALGLGYFWCLFGSKQTWHDKLSKTKTVLLPKT